MPPLRDNEKIVTEPDGSQSLQYTITLDFGPMVRAMRKAAEAIAWVVNQREINRAFLRAIAEHRILSLPPGPTPYWLSRYDGETGRRAIEGLANPLPIGGTDQDLPWPRYRPEDFTDNAADIAKALAEGIGRYERS